jgi:hypothetical protein
MSCPFVPFGNSMKYRAGFVNNRHLDENGGPEDRKEYGLK